MTVKFCQTVNNVVILVVVNHADIVKGQSQKKGVSLAIVQCQELKYVNNVSCVDQLNFVQPIPDV